MIIVGLHTGHDASISLVKDGKLIGSTATERYSKVKKDYVITKEQLSFFLDAQAGLKIEDVDVFTFSTWLGEMVPWMNIYSPHESKYPLATYGSWSRETVIMNHLPEKPKVENTEWGYTLPGQIQRDCTPFMSGDINYGQWFPLNVRIEGVDKTFKGAFVNHHGAHAASAYYTSGFDKAAIFTVDASMHIPEMSSSWWVANGSTIHQFKCPGYMYGNFYDVATEHLGLGPGTIKAGSLMGLAAYGRPSLDAYTKWEEWTTPYNNRKHDREEHRYIDWLFLQMSKRFPFVGERLRSGILKNEPDAMHFNREWQEPFTKEESTTQEAMDIAATIQFVAERSLTKYAQDLFEETKDINGGNLCMAGGTFLNCNANYKIRTETGFERTHVYPAAGDDGTSAGSALYYSNFVLKEPRHQYSASDLAYTGVTWYDGHLNGDPLDLNVVAQALNEDKIICWYQGRSENGPRALGNRSFLASPKNPKMKDILNSRVKFREWYRPFAPIVLEEKAEEWFLLDGHKTPFMLHTAPCKRPFEIPSAVHIDNSARVQTLARETNPKLYSLIEQFETLSGIPIVINTSLNIKGQPIVESPNDAMYLFNESDVDILVINDKMWFKDKQTKAD